VKLAEAHTASRATRIGAAPMFAVSAAGQRATAWVSAPHGGSDGRLYVVVDSGEMHMDRAPAELSDSLGAIEAHGEAPPKLAFAPNGSLVALYVVGKEVPGRRFPMSALRFTRSDDGGAHWSSPVSVTDASTFGSYNFHSLHVSRDGTVYVAWLDGRDGKSAAYMTRSTDGGRTWQPNVRIASGEACPCCRTAIATGTDGTVYAAWRQVFAGSVRDIVVARSTDHGATWSEPVKVHEDAWKIDACPHAGPAVQVDAQNRVHVAWWTGKPGAAGVFYARSSDHGRSFEAPVTMKKADASMPSHVQLALGDSGRVLVAWDDGTRRTPRVLLRVSRDGGQHFGGTDKVSPEDRVASFPVLAIAGDRVMVAWSEESQAAARREAAAKPKHDDPHASMGMPKVGEQVVMMREGKM
jgi:hypothetical protein